MRILSPFFNNWLTVCLTGLLLFSGCSSTPTSSVDNSGQKSEAAPAMPGNYDKALVLMQSGDYQSALPVLLDFIDKNPQLAGPYINLGIAYQHTDQDEAAMEALKKAVELTHVRINPTQLAGKYGQLTFRLNYWGPTGNQKDTRVDVR
ncbi:MAG: hypothetical protein U9Q19_04705, partial [Pseudomonadota bacterium]|nr:hypothetical protein [Pseudomonadota bacterium]